MRSMFRPIKKIFTYIQKNASNGTMFGTTTSIIKPEVDGAASSTSGIHLAVEDELNQLPLKQEVETQQLLHLDDEDIERQIKTSIIDASKVHAAKAKLVLPLHLQLDDELADFAHEPIGLSNVAVGEEGDDDDDLEEHFLELENFPNNEIIVLSDQDLNSSLASDNISEDPLAIDDFGQKEADEEEEEADSSGDLMWLKLDTPTTVNSNTSSISSVLPVPGCSSSLIASTTAAATSVKPPIRRREEELRSDGGSDSGLGSENDRQNITTTTSLHKPLRSNLKRRLDDDAMDLALLPISSCSNAQKRPKRSINFDNVKVYYFPRQQGFSCVPTAGGCTLGMGARHIAFKTMTLAEHASELRRAHRSQNQELQQQHHQQQQQLQARGSSSDDSEESEEDYLSDGSGSDADDGSNGFLQPVTPKQRRVLLKAAGVRKIDASEKSDCRDIRNSREVCGCSCREFCDPETCACSQAGIKCQVDRAMFPCGCTREACGNTVGRVEFNPTRVRTHYIHTVMRLDMEQRQSQGQSSANSSNGLVYGSSISGSSASGVVSPSASSGASSTHCFFMQPQSNYSSGYASPAYTPETSVSYYQQHQQTPLRTQTPPGSTGNSSTAQQSSYATIYPQLDSLDAGLFATGSNATPSYGELLTPTFHQTLSYGSTQLNSYGSYQQTTTASGGNASPVGYSSCAVPSVPPFGIATTTASNVTQYQHVNVLETTAATMIRSSNSSISLTASSCATGLARLGGAGPVDFIRLNAPISSSSRLSQINDLLQHNRSTTAALVAVSEGYAAVRSSSSTTTTNTNNTSTTIDSIDTPPIVEEAQRSCMTFEGLPPPLINPTPIVAVLEQPHKQLMDVSTTPQPRQPLDVSATLTESLSSRSN